MYFQKMQILGVFRPFLQRSLVQVNDRCKNRKLELEVVKLFCKINSIFRYMIFILLILSLTSVSKTLGQSAVVILLSSQLYCFSFNEICYMYLCPFIFFHRQMFRQTKGIEYLVIFSCMKISYVVTSYLLKIHRQVKWLTLAIVFELIQYIDGHFKGMDDTHEY